MRKALANDGDQTLFERAIFSFNFASGDERTEVYFTFHSVIIWDNTGMIAFPRNAVMMMLRMRHSPKPSGWRLNIFLFSPCLAYKCAHSQSTCSGLYLCTKHIFPTLMLKVNVTHSFYLPASLSASLYWRYAFEQSNILQRWIQHRVLYYYYFLGGKFSYLSIERKYDATQYMLPVWSHRHRSIYMDVYRSI